MVKHLLEFHQATLHYVCVLFSLCLLPCFIYIFVISCSTHFRHVSWTYFLNSSRCHASGTAIHFALRSRNWTLNPSLSVQRQQNWSPILQPKIAEQQVETRAALFSFPLSCFIYRRKVETVIRINLNNA